MGERFLPSHLLMEELFLSYYRKSEKIRSKRGEKLARQEEINKGKQKGRYSHGY